MSKTIMPIKDFDFGIDFADDLSEVVESKANAADHANAKAEALYNAIMPLLNNLKRNPEKPNIVWPDREKKIDLFIEKLDSIMNSEM
jgi:hypothetical protein